MNPVITHPSAQDEIDNALAASRDPATFRAAIADALATIGANPQIAATIGRTRVRQYLLRPFPYSIIYVETATGIRFLAFPHSSRRHGYWKKRLP